MRKISILGILLLPFGLFAQDSKVSEENFDRFCLEEALVIMNVSPEKSERLEFDGNLPNSVLKLDGNYSDYGLVLENERTQYYSVTDSDKIIAVQSLYRLKVQFDTQNQQVR